MKILQGQGVSKGVEHGPIYFCRRSQTLIQPDKADDPRFRGAAGPCHGADGPAAGTDGRTGPGAGGDSAAQLFETHAMFLEDEDYTGAMEELLAEGYCAEYAVDQAGEQFSAMLAAMDDPYMQARACDVKDVHRAHFEQPDGRGGGGHRLPGAGDPGRPPTWPPPRPSSWTRARSWATAPGRLQGTATPPSCPALGHPRGLRLGASL